MGRPLRVLIVEDRPDDAEQILAALTSGGYDPSWERVETADGLRAALAAGPWEIVTSAYFLPGFGGGAALELVRETEPDLPFIVVSETVGEDSAVALMRAGASDYVRKHDLARLAPAVEREVTAVGNRRAKRVAERAAAHWAAVVESSDDAIISKTLDGVLTSWNHAAELLYGWSAAEAIGRNISFLIPPDKAAEQDEILRSVAAGEKVEYFETVRLHKDGRRLDVSMTVSPVRGLDGQLIGVSKTARNIMIRKRAEQELRFQHAVLRCQSEASPDGILVVGTGNRVLSYNRRFLSVWGIREELVTIGDDTTVLAMARSLTADPDGFYVRVLAIYADPDLQTQDEIALADGRTLDRYSGPIRGADGVLLGRVWYFRDITVKKRAVEAAYQSEAIKAAIVESALDCIVTMDAEGRIVEFNPAAERTFGLTRVAALGKTVAEVLVPPAFRESHRRGLAHYLATGEGPVLGRLIELSALRADGTEFPVEMAITPLEIGGRRHFTAFLRDLTERKRAEEALQESRQRLVHVLASSPAVLFTLEIADEQIRGINWISDNLRELSGYDPEAAFDRDWWLGNIHPDDRDGTVAVTHAELFAHGRVSHEYRFRHRDGTYRWTRGEIRLIRDAEGRPTEAVGSWSDITERKLLEEQFRQAQKLEAVGQLAGGIAHDFNNLLTVINGYSELLLQDLPAGDPSRDLVGEIHKAGERSAGLTRQLLAFSRQQVLAPQVLDLNSVATETGKMLRRLIGEDIRLATALAPQLGLVRADPGQIEQILMNLAVNARDAMPRGGRLTIETRNVELDESYARTHADASMGPHVLLSVADNGSGMSPDVAARIFEPFFTTKGVGKGTGLGLATVYGIVKQSGGHIAVYSEVGHGTTFKVYLPRVEAPVSKVKGRSWIQAPPRGTETILVVEDEDGVRALTRHILSGCGYTVLEAADGEEALRILADHEGAIHLLISDVVMPGMGGRVVAESVAERHPGVRVLFVSGYTDDAVIRHGVLQEGVNFLQKPFSAAALAIKVREVLDAPS